MKLKNRLLLAATALAGRWAARTTRTEFANIGEGVVGGRKTYAAEGAITTRQLLVKTGSDGNHVTLAGATDAPIGVITDEAAAAEDRVNVNLLGSCAETQKMVASGAITVGSFVVSDAGGKVRTLPGTAGTYYVVGRALTAAAADGDVIEVDPIPSVARVV